MLCSGLAIGPIEALDDLPNALDANGFDALAIDATHALAAGVLPAHHADPFDRMLIVQSRIESLTLVTVDRRSSDYEVDLLPLA